MSDSCDSCPRALDRRTCDECDEKRIAAAIAAERARCAEINRVRLLPDFPGEFGPDCSEPECIACWATKAIESGESSESFTARVEALRAKWRAEDESGAPAPREG